MEVINNHIINRETILLAGEFGFEGIRCTRVMEGKNIFLVKQSPKKAINTTLRYIGSSLKGATESSRFLLGIRKLCPIMVNPMKDVCLFPIHSPDFDFNLWFNPEHILKAIEKNDRSIIYLSNGYFIEVDLKLHLLNSRIHNANQLRRLTKYNSEGDYRLHVEPHQDLLLTREKNGRYNFHILENTRIQEKF